MPTLNVAPLPLERATAILQSGAECSLSPRPVALRVTDLRKSYGGVEAVRGVSFAVHQGEVFGLLGPNGAGKTTTISMIATQIQPSAGTADVFGHDITTDMAGVRYLIGVAPQDIAVYPTLTAGENLRFFGRIFGVRARELRQRVQDLLALVELDTRQNEPVSQFSGGMRRRLNLAVSMMHNPRLLLLDEPTVGVDPHSREQIFAIIRNLRDQGTAIVYTTHYMEEAEALCDRIAVLDEGRIITMGPLTELLAAAGCAEVIEVRGLPLDVDLGAVARAAGVSRIERSDRAVRIFTQGAARVLPALGVLIRGYESQVSVQIAPLSLQTLFLQLTGKEVRD